MNTDLVGILYGLACAIIGAILGFNEGSLRGYRKRLYEEAEELESDTKEKHEH